MLSELPLTDGVQRVFLDRSRRLSTAAQTLLCVAAADDSTRVGVVRQAAELLGVGPGAWTEAEESGLLTGRRNRRSDSVTRWFVPPSTRAPQRMSGPAGAPGPGPGDDRRSADADAGPAPRRGGRRPQRRKSLGRWMKRRPARRGQGWLRGRQCGLRTRRRADQRRTWPQRAGLSRGGHQHLPGGSVAAGDAAGRHGPEPVPPIPWCGRTWTASAAESNSSPVPCPSGVADLYPGRPGRGGHRPAAGPGDRHDCRGRVHVPTRTGPHRSRPRRTPRRHFPGHLNPGTVFHPSTDRVPPADEFLMENFKKGTSIRFKRIKVKGQKS